MPVHVSRMIISRAGLPGLEFVQIDEVGVPVWIEVVEFSSVMEDVVVVLAALAEVPVVVGLHPCILLSIVLLHGLFILSLCCMILRRRTRMAHICTRSAMTLRSVTI